MYLPCPLGTHGVASARIQCGPPRRRVLVIGGSFSGLAAGRDLGRHFLVTIIDAKEFGETGASLGLGQL